MSNVHEIYPDDRIVLPLGSVEQHAYLSLCVDVILAQRVAYCLRALDVLVDGGKRGRAPLHRRVV